MTVAIVMDITNSSKLFHYGVNRDQHEKLIIIREFSERLAQDLFNINFSPETGTLAKGTTPLYEVDEVQIVSTFR